MKNFDSRLRVNVLLDQLKTIVGHRYVLTEDRQTARYRYGYRFGGGSALAVVCPRTLVEQWRVLLACVSADVTVIFQAANTGLTGGSTPNGDDYPGGVVIISTTRIKGVFLLDGGKQAICLPGTTLHELEMALKPYGRVPHSVIGSSCIGASVFGGICNNSGGALVKRGPAYTECALFASLTKNGELGLVNHIDLPLGSTPDEILTRLQEGCFQRDGAAVRSERRASDDRYADHIRDVSAATPARYNGDPRCLFEASGSAGKLALFAVRLDTFRAPVKTATFYIGTNDTDELSDLRREILNSCEHLPVAAEYIHRNAFDMAAIYGKDLFLSVRLLGTKNFPMLFAFRSRIEAALERIGVRPGFMQRLMHRGARLFPEHLSRRIRMWRDSYDHHLLLKAEDAGIPEVRHYLARRFPSANGDYFECTPEESERAFLHRFAVAAAAVNCSSVQGAQKFGLVSLDVALPRNAQDWFESLPPDIARDVVYAVYYGHFFCHVFHQDYVLRPAADEEDVKKRILNNIQERGGIYPAEHGFGHIYEAPPAMEKFLRKIDPRNQLNPGIGKTTRERSWKNAS